ncbi:hypothetical protein FH608_037150 [Nonomuraea phyllanthi]|uniref:Uncharacterized protein n=1 Tax=Nonomuraea phyllanthi TaxID=2219224 RepID=A0A5C4VTA3_9ACTN|nr:HalX domain-containing protein [Nonomuraea phyllanthi]KAB8190080.1 hypothetical protein FH608_037150 [Nonomuraea phyllanthi]QFY08577.1 hypothetical protein GBF35_19540 [Nonomuraea phyllanthi]
MDVQAEILDLKLRVDGLEMSGRPDGPASAAGGEHHLLHEINDRTKRLAAELAVLKAELAAARIETNEQFGAVDVEIAAIRREVHARLAAEDAVPTQVADEFATVRSDIAQEFTSVQSELRDLSIKIDRLLKQDYL